MFRFNIWLPGIIWLLLLALFHLVQTFKGELQCVFWRTLKCTSNLLYAFHLWVLEIKAVSWSPVIFMAWLFYQDVPLIATGASYVQVGYFNGVGPVNTAWQACKLSWRAAVHILPGLCVYTPLVYGALMNSASFCHTFKCVSLHHIF